VVGGGAVAARRVLGLLSAGAHVTVVSPTVDASLPALAGGAEGTAPGIAPALVLERRPYRSGEAGGYQFVVTATGRPEVDGAVVQDARGAGILVASAERRAGTVRLPAVHRSGPVTLAVSTAGTSPALARWLRTRLAACLPSAVDTIAALVDEARTEQRTAGRPTTDVDWGVLLDQHVVPLIEAGRVAEAREILRSARVPSDPE
jgi:precorrin-2 dehydrogenase/sirohydrochlorin ferrochelatase